MKQLTRLALSLPLVLGLLSPAAFSQTSTCKPGNTRNTAYMQRRGDQRCEGITTPQASGHDFGLQSFTIGSIPNSSKLSLAIPKLTNLSQPTLRVKSTSDRYYQLDPLTLKDADTQWQFQWPNTVLRRENIPLSNLRSLAEAGSGRIFIPVRFSSSSSYDFRVYTGNRTKTITFKILDSKGNPIYETTKTNQPGTEVAFTWDGRTSKNRLAGAGRYTLSLEAEIERPNAPPETRQSTRQFEHNPAWLK